MLAIDVSDSDLVLAMPHRHGGVARVLMALEGIPASRQFAGGQIIQVRRLDEETLP